MSLGTAFPMILGSWLVRPIPLPASETSVSPTLSVQRIPDSRTHLLYSELPEETDEVESQQDSPVGPTIYTCPVQDVWGLQLFESPDFWLFFVILVLCEFVYPLLAVDGALNGHSTRDRCHVCVFVRVVL